MVQKHQIFTWFSRVLNRRFLILFFCQKICRKIFDENNLNDLTNSIKERGMIQPIIVRKSNDDNSKYEIITRLIGKKSKKNLSILSDIKKNDFK